MKETLVRVIPVAMVVAIMGALFKIMHWPGANILLLIGLLSVGLLAAIRLGLEGGITSKLSGVAALLLAIGVLFKMLHWPYGQEMVIIALGLGFILLVIFTVKRDSN
ncbi:MAG: hypothetical protein U0V74_06250 [Chitinophagales bacterium]